MRSSSSARRRPPAGARPSAPIASPSPSAVRRSVDCTSAMRAGIAGAPGRSIRRNTIPCPDGAAEQRAVTSRPVWRPDAARPRAGPASVRLAHRACRRHQPLELGDDRGQPVQRRLRPEELAVRAGRMAAERRRRPGCRRTRRSWPRCGRGRRSRDGRSRPRGRPGSRRSPIRVLPAMPDAGHEQAALARCGRCGPRGPGCRAWCPGRRPCRPRCPRSMQELEPISTSSSRMQPPDVGDPVVPAGRPRDSRTRRRRSPPRLDHDPAPDPGVGVADGPWADARCPRPRSPRRRATRPRRSGTGRRAGRRGRAPRTGRC